MVFSKPHPQVREICQINCEDIFSARKILRSFVKSFRCNGGVNGTCYLVKDIISKTYKFSFADVAREVAWITGKFHWY